LALYSWEIRIRQAQALQAGLYANPDLKVQVGEVGRKGGRGGVAGSEASLVLGQLIDLTNKPSQKRAIGLLEARLAGWDYEAARLAVYKQVVQAFVEVLTAQELWALRAEQVALAERALKAVADRVATGKDAPTEQTKATIALSKTQIEHRRTEHRLAAARKVLAATWGSHLPDFDAVVGELETLWTVEPCEVLYSQLEQNPALARWPTELEKREESIRLEESRAIPDPVLFGGIQQFNEQDETALLFGVGIPLPVWDRNQGNLLAAQHAKSKTQARQRAAQAKLMAELAVAYKTLVSAYSEAADLKKTIVPLSEKVFEATGQAYVGGKVGYLQVLDSQRTYFAAKARYLEALGAYHKARANVEQLIAAPLAHQMKQDHPGPPRTSDKTTDAQSLRPVIESR